MQQGNILVGESIMRYISVFLGVLGLDQLLKLLVKASFTLHDSIPIIKPFLYLTYVKNEGIAFGLFQGMNSISILPAIIVVIGAFIYTMVWRPPAIVTYSLALIAGGAAGNLIDRVIFGGVVDYIDFRFWPVFNLADIAIVMGSILLMGFVIWEGREEGKKPWR